MNKFFVKVLQRTLVTHSQIGVQPFIYMQTNWLEDSTELLLFSTADDTCYQATLKHDEIKIAAEELEQPSYDDFFAECKKALTTHMGLESFEYELDEEHSQFKLWKCVGFETMYVDMPIRKVSNLHQLLDAASECAQQKRQEHPQTSISAIPTDAASCSVPPGFYTRDYDLLAQEYEKYIDASKEQEQALLKKFFLLLNSKKERIAELMKEVEELRKLAAEAAEPVDDSDTEEEDYHPKVTDVGAETFDADFKAATQQLTEQTTMQE